MHKLAIIKCFCHSLLQVKGVIEHVMDAAGGQRRTSVRAVSHSLVTSKWLKKAGHCEMINVCLHLNVQKFVFSTFGHMTECHFH